MDAIVKWKYTYIIGFCSVFCFLIESCLFICLRVFYQFLSVSQSLRFFLLVSVSLSLFPPYISLNLFLSFVYPYKVSLSPLFLHSQFLFLNPCHFFLSLSSYFSSLSCCHSFTFSLFLSLHSLPHWASFTLCPSLFAPLLFRISISIFIFCLFRSPHTFPHILLVSTISFTHFPSLLSLSDWDSFALCFSLPDHSSFSYCYLFLLSYFSCLIFLSTSLPSLFLSLHVSYSCSLTLLSLVLLLNSSLFLFNANRDFIILSYI